MRVPSSLLRASVSRTVRPACAARALLSTSAPAATVGIAAPKRAALLLNDLKGKRMASSDNGEIQVSLLGHA